MKDQPTGNAKKVVQLQSVVAEALTEALKRSFNGSVSIELRVEDGVIQDITRTTKQVKE